MAAPRFKVIDRVSYRTLLIYAGDSPNYSGAVEAMICGDRAKLYSLKGAGFYELVQANPEGVFEALGATAIEADVRLGHLRLMRMSLKGKCEIREIGEIEIAGYPMRKVEIRLLEPTTC